MLVKKLIIVFICFWWTNLGFTQLSENFSNGDISSNPSWTGDIMDFETNEVGQLQLAALESGTSFIHTPYTSQSEQEWQLYFKMGFNPSASNRLEVFLELDSENLDQANGYSFEIGENGSTDAITFYKYINGTRSEMARGMEGDFATDPSEARVKIIRSLDGFWEVSLDIGNTGLLSTALEFFDDDIVIQNAIFGLSPTYSSSRADKFFFDDIYIGPIIIDVDPPKITSLQVIDPRTLNLLWDEPLDAASAQELQNYTVSPSDNTLASITYSNLTPNKVVLNFQDDFSSNISYQLTAQNIQDLIGNIAPNNQATFEVLAIATAGSLLINEILFNPKTGGTDFVEIINISDQTIDLQDISITNTFNGQIDPIIAIGSIEPGEILAFSENIEFLSENYDLRFPQNVWKNDLPAFNNDEGNVSIVHTNGEIIDSFDYTEDLHFDLLDDPDGVSLERVSTTIATNQIDNWTSAASAIGFATPGYINSASFNPSSNLMDMFELNKNVFSPDNDNNDDKFIVEYELDQNSYVINADVYDDQGRRVKHLLRNEQLGTKGFFVWDGLNENQELADLGIYVLWIQLFSPSGEVSERKFSFVLANSLN